jgi:tetratricopeptide (TPR) repeat protein
LGKEELEMLVDAKDLFDSGRGAFKQGNTLEALKYFEMSIKVDPDNPVCTSYIGVCIASERGQVTEALKLCQEALKKAPQESDTYVNLGRVFQRSGQKKEAVKVLRDGLKIDGNNPELIYELQALGMRKRLILSFLPRNNVLNKYLGMFLNRMGLR